MIYIYIYTTLNPKPDAFHDSKDPGRGLLRFFRPWYESRFVAGPWAMVSTGAGVLLRDL